MRPQASLGDAPVLTVHETSPSRIAVFLPSFRGGGAERAMLLFAEGLLAEGFAVDLIVADPSGPLANEVPAAARLIKLGTPRVFRAILPLIRYLRSVEVVALYTTMMHANVVALLAQRLSRRDIPVVVRESNMPFYARQRSFSGTVLYFIYPWVYRWAETIIGVSQDVARAITDRDSALRTRVRVLPNPVIREDIEEHASRVPSHDWFHDSKIPVFVSAGRLHPQKDYPTLLHAFYKVRSARHCRLVILGEGSERAKLEKLRDELRLTDDVLFPGFDPNPFPFIKRAAAFVLPSRYEGMPNALIQAMALGTPVISTDCPGGPREVLADGRFGTLVPVGDSEALGKAMLAALDSPRRLDAARYAVETYGVQRATRTYLSTLSARGVV